MNDRSEGFNYKYKSYVRQEEFDARNCNDNEAALYGIQMNPYLQGSKQYIFAAVGRNRATIYECNPNGKIELKQTYVDCCKEENFYCCCWSFQAIKRDLIDHLLIVGGARGIIRIINIQQMKSTKTLKGHGSSINDLRTHPLDPNLILSTSKDHSIRIWNIRTEILIAIFGGVEGHRDEVLSADFHLSLKYIVSCGMDHSVKIWRLDSDRVKEAIDASRNYNHLKDKQPFKTIKVSFPMFSTRNIHHNYVDSVCWFGNFILSKSCENSIILWKPGKLDENIAENVSLPTYNYTTDQSTSIIHKFEIHDGNIWFIRLTLNLSNRVLAVGNSSGQIFVWKIDKEDPTISKKLILKAPKCKQKPIRQIAFSLDSKIMIAISDDSSIWRFDLEEEEEEDDDEEEDDEE